MSRGGLEAWLRWSARPFGGVECRGHVQGPAFAHLEMRYYYTPIRTVKTKPNKTNTIKC